MIVVRIESGLGNQMLDYAEYVAVRNSHKDITVYADLTIFDINERVELPISQWNGYELESIFDIKVPTLKDLLKGEYENLIDRLIESKFWDNDWIYAPVIVGFLEEKGIHLDNLCALGTNGPSKVPFSKRVLKQLRERNYILYRYGYTNICRIIGPRLNREKNSLFYLDNHDSFYCGQTLNFMLKGFGLEKIKDKLFAEFKFPLDRISQENKEFLESVKNHNFTSLHVRRGDFLVKNDFCYRFGYFGRAVNYIRKKTGCSKYVFFCDSTSVDWVKDNMKMFALKDSDEISFVTWNKGRDSFWDIYLMSKCQNNIVTQSSFGWWATFFNDNQNKITCSPDVRINTTNWF